MEKEEKQVSVLGEPTALNQKEHHLPQPWYEKLILAAGGLFSLWLLVCCVAESLGLWTRESGAYKTYSVLMWGAVMLYAAAILMTFWDRTRGGAFFCSLAGAVISIATGVSLASTDKLGYINEMNQTFTETIPFWWGHIIPGSIVLICGVLWFLSRSRRKREEQIYELDLKGVVHHVRRPKKGNRNTAE